MTTVTQFRKHVAALESGADHLRQETLQSLRGVAQNDWQSAPPDLVQSLLDALQQQLRREPRLAVVDKTIAVVLNNMGTLSKSAVPQLTELLKEGVPDCVRENAAVALGKIGSDAKSAVDSLAELASAPSSPARHAVQALGEIGVVNPRVRATLTQLWRTPAQSYHASVQLAVTLCKLHIHVDGAGSFLADTLLDGNQDEAIRRAAADGLSHCNKSEVGVIPALLLARAADKSETIQQAALAACTRLCPSPDQAIRECAKQLKDAPRAEVALRKTGAPAIPALIGVLGAAEESVRLVAMRVLSSFGELAVDAVKDLTELLRDRSPDVRLAAAKCMWNVTKKADLVVPVLVQLLDDKRALERLEDEARRMYLQTIMEAISRIGPAAATAAPAISIKMKDKNRLVQQTAQETLKRIQPGK